MAVGVNTVVIGLSLKKRNRALSVILYYCNMLLQLILGVTSKAYQNMCIRGGSSTLNAHPGFRNWYVQLGFLRSIASQDVVSPIWYSYFSKAPTGSSTPLLQSWLYASFYTLYMAEQACSWQDSSCEIRSSSDPNLVRCCPFLNESQAKVAHGDTNLLFHEEGICEIKPRYDHATKKASKPLCFIYILYFCCSRTDTEQVHQQEGRAEDYNYRWFR